MATNAAAVELRDSAGDPTTAGLAVGGATVIVLVGGGVTAATGSDYVPSVIALAGVVFVAILTVITTNRRQTKQLAAESDRLTRQLAQQRDLGELSHLREFFDEMAASYETRHKALSELSGKIAAFCEDRGGIGEVDAAIESEFEASAVMTVLDRRLRLRLPGDHAVAVEYQAMRDAMTDGSLALYGSVHVKAYDAEKVGLAALMEALRGCGSWMRHGPNWIGAQRRSSP